MAQVQVSVHGRMYTIDCGEGEEPHLQGLAGLLDKRVKEIAASVGNDVGEARLLLLAGLLVADELAAGQERIAQLEEEVDQARSHAAALEGRLSEEIAQNDAVRNEAAEIEARASESLNSAAERLEAVAGRLGRT